MFGIKKPKLSFIDYVIGLKIGYFKPSTVMLYQIPDKDITIKELWKWCKE